MISQNDGLTFSNEPGAIKKKLIDLFTDVTVFYRNRFVKSMESPDNITQSDL